MSGSIFSILMAALASFFLGAVWYGVLGQQWMAAANLSKDKIEAMGRPLPVLLATSFVTALVMAAVLSSLIGMSGERSIEAGLRIALLVWLGFVATTMIVNHGYQGAKWSLTLIDGGHWLAVLLLQGLVLGWMR